MPGEIDGLARPPSSFYGSHKYFSRNGYCTRQTVSQQKNTLESGLTVGSRKLMLYSRMNGGKLRCSRLKFGSSSKTATTVHQSSSQLARRHCRYINMSVRRFPRKQLGCSTTDGVNGVSSSHRIITGACRPNVSTMKTSLMEKSLIRNRESRVLISAELKNKADSEMKNVHVNIRNKTDCKRNVCGSRVGSDRKAVQRKDTVEKTDGTGKREKSYDTGLKLRNGKSFPDCEDVKQTKLVSHTAGGRQSAGNDVNLKKRKVKYRSRSLSPAVPLALARPRRSAGTKKSVCFLFADFPLKLL